MARYFIDVAYMGAKYNGFQVQDTGLSIQGEIDKALSTLARTTIQTTGSSRTDAGVHAKQNFLHFDFEGELNPQLTYKMNALLPRDIVVNNFFKVDDEAHSRFAATSRAYEYTLFTYKDPFFQDRGYYFPYKVDIDLLQAAATILMQHTNFETFSKRNTQVHTFNCTILHSYWEQNDQHLKYYVKGNRFLRGMVRGLVGTMLRVGRGRLTLEQFEEVILSRDCSNADFAVPPQGLCLMEVAYPADLVMEKVF
ncbi:tRNA pseudouridine38-40 synthase [Chitinophaga skermanii]|uniref:tRNA pseudouridine synthase A n=1 Tax=Chitinophaga skermanii TaxID=331697 RepID=A0A327QJ76_9BACT|nr:tRNA pseudouridine(38-40) synthase TruA [Chitinophaga skermanii]RAJ04321.1 tRNA pseudouridine38-40 synthase [Chitinophaga skermanii]